MKKKILIPLILIVVFCAEIYVLKRYGSGSVNDKLGLVLSIIGFYSIAIGFIKKSVIGKTFSRLLDEMTSANPISFIAGNFIFMGMLLQLVSIGFDKERDPNSSTALGCFGTVLLLLALPLIMTYIIFHFVVILPMAYISYLISSAFIETICGASNDIEMSGVGADNQVKNLSLKNIINSDRESSKSFLIGIPATLFSFVVKIISVFNHP